MEISSAPADAQRRAILRLLAGTAAGAFALYIPDPARAGAKKKSLQPRVDAYVKSMRRAGRVSANEKTSWSVFDFTTNKKLVSINEDVPRQAASMIKPFVAQAYFYRHRQAPSRYPLNAEVETLLEAMIRRSRNGATNELIARISRKPRADRPKEVERVLRSHAAGVFQQVEIVEYIPRGGRTYLNKASARDYSRFLYAMWNDKLPNAADMKYLMSLPNKDRIRDGTTRVPENCRVIDKTGSTARLCGNMGVMVAKGLDGKEYPYTLIGIIEKSRRPKSYSRWIQSRGDVIRGVSDLVYADMRQRYRLV
jgi:beta-lactamase class A